MLLMIAGLWPYLLLSTRATTAGSGNLPGPGIPEGLATLVAALVAAAVTVLGFGLGVFREWRRAVLHARARRAAWVAYLVDLWRYMDLNRRTGVIWDMAKVNTRLELALPVAYDPAGIDGLTPKQIENVLAALLDTKLAAENVDIHHKDMERAVSEMIMGNDKAQAYHEMREAAKGFCTGAAEKLKVAIESLRGVVPESSGQIEPII